MPTAQTTSTADAILNDLFQTAEKSQAGLRQRIDRSNEIVQTIDALGMEAKQVASIRDESRRKIAERVLNAKLEQVRTDAAQEERDLAEAVVGFQGLVEQMGGEYTKLTTFSPAEQAVIDEAKAALAQAENALATAKQAWFFPKRKIVQANTALNAAKLAVPAAESVAKTMQRDRLMSAKMEESFQDLLLRAERIIHIMKERRQTIIAELTALQGRHSEVMNEQLQASKAMEMLETEVATKKRELAEAEEKLSTIPRGPEQVEQSRLVSELMSQHEELVGKYNAALGIFQTAENFAVQFQQHEITQMKLRDNMRIWIEILERSSKSRVRTMSSRLVAMKAAADQEVASILDQVGATVDLKNTEAIVAMGVAADRARVEMMEDLPERYKDQYALAVAQVKAHVAQDTRMQELIVKYKENYGIDLLGTSIFNPESRPEGTTARS